MFNQRVVREGITAGLLGASAVAILFLIVDLIGAAPLHTPRLLGQAFFSVFTPAARTAEMWPVAGYTVVHFAAFIGLGLLVAKLVEMSDRTPAVLAFVFLSFAIVAAGLSWLSAMLSIFSGFGNLAWYQVLLANLVAAGVMGAYLLRAHPEALPRLDAALKGTT